jgi:hypothetical protein
MPVLIPPIAKSQTQQNGSIGQLILEGDAAKNRKSGYKTVSVFLHLLAG